VYLTALEIANKKFGKLQIKIPQDITVGSHKKVSWVCDCGKEKLIQTSVVLSGQSISCGRCNIISSNEISSKKFGKLRIKTPQDILPGSNKKVEWICDCEREKLISIYSVIYGYTTSCGRCNIISSNEIPSKKFGKLRIKKPQDIKPGSNKKIWWVCDCGKEKLISIHSVLSNITTSCNMCNSILSSEIAIKKFGKLRIKVPQDILPGSERKIEWTCDCGKEKLIRIDCVLSGNTKSCGQCSESVKDWYIQNREQIHVLKCPVDPKDFPLGGIIPLEIINRSHIPFKAICPACKSEYHPRLDGIKQGKSLTCGCSTYRISMPVIQITKYIRSLGFEVQNEFKVNKLAYDIFVPAKNLLIEFQGSKWHSFEKSKERDLKKKQNAIQMGYQFMEILEKNWNIFKKNEIESELN
jgi:hypothetical protein